MALAQDDRGANAIVRAVALLRATRACYERVHGDMLVAAVSYYVLSCR